MTDALGRAVPASAARTTRSVPRPAPGGKWKGVHDLSIMHFLLGGFRSDRVIRMVERVALGRDEAGGLGVLV